MTNYRKIISKDSAVIINHPEDKFETLLFLPPTESRKGEGGLRKKCSLDLKNLGIPRRPFAQGSGLASLRSG